MKKLFLICLLFGLGFTLGASAQETTTVRPSAPAPAAPQSMPQKKVKVIYKENQTLDFEGLSLEGELKTPGEFYFQNRNQERFDTLTKRRLNFHREMLRDSVQSQ